MFHNNGKVNLLYSLFGICCGCSGNLCTTLHIVFYLIISLPLKIWLHFCIKLGHCIRSTHECLWNGVRASALEITFDGCTVHTHFLRSNGIPYFIIFRLSSFIYRALSACKMNFITFKAQQNSTHNNSMLTKFCFLWRTRDHISFQCCRCCCFSYHHQRWFELSFFFCPCFGSCTSIYLASIISSLKRFQC